ncbi:hypothetical protein B0H15DRAFT_947827 [Mycena belliarum]|uniref:Uncharacterized protein n=1 Tax=Mycena belliarum TaxID=1033014 RepID=A0AAD6XTS1_9AGAR|nr:hypothetical protein B0H15DRAFT_947827 [Mycena belliae]
MNAAHSTPVRRELATDGIALSEPPTHPRSSASATLDPTHHPARAPSICELHAARCTPVYPATSVPRTQPRPRLHDSVCTRASASWRSVASSGDKSPPPAPPSPPTRELRARPSPHSTCRPRQCTCPRASSSANPSRANSAVLAILPACALSTPPTAPPPAAHAELPPNPRSPSTPYLRQAQPLCTPPDPRPSPTGAVACPPVPRAFVRVALMSRDAFARWNGTRGPPATRDSPPPMPVPPSRQILPLREAAVAKG